MGGVGSSSDSSRPVFQEFPGLTGSPEGQAINDQIQGLLGQMLGTTNGVPMPTYAPQPQTPTQQQFDVPQPQPSFPSTQVEDMTPLEYMMRNKQPVQPQPLPVMPSQPAPPQPSQQPGTYTTTKGIFPTDTGQSQTAPGLEQLPPLVLPEEVNTPIESKYFQLLFDALTNPNYSPNSAAEENLLNDLGDRTQGTAALRGLGPATPGALAQVLAPTLTSLRQNEIGNLVTALTQDVDTQLKDRGQGIDQRGQTITGLLGGRGQDVTQRGQNIQTNELTLQTLLTLAEFLMPTILGGQESQGRSGSFNVVAPTPGKTGG